MMSEESRERRIALRLLVGVSAIVTVLAALILIAAAATLPGMSEWVVVNFDSGIGLKNAAIASAVTSFAVLIVFALVSGDGLIGEIQFMIPGFFLFFVFFWLLLAWVF